MHRVALGLFIALAGIALPVFARDEILWRDPGRVERLDFRWGPGGRANAPVTPFRFVKEDLSGTKAKVNIVDARGHAYNVKFGFEVPGECFGARMMWAAGYFIEPAYCVPGGRILGTRGLSKRARKFIAPDGSFRDGRFQLRDPSLKFMDDHNWSWTNNPFLGSHELAGLKILIMLTSNWDNKDARDADKGINTAIFERPGRKPRYIYTFTDWGESMGGWGHYLDRKAWSCGRFSEETPRFVSVVDGRLEWGYGGVHRHFKQDITVADIRWLLHYIGRISNSQLRDGLLASGATPAEAACFKQELRRRIDMLRTIASNQ